MRKWKLLIIVAMLVLSVTGIGFAAGYVNDFSVEYDEPIVIVETDCITVAVSSIEVEDDYLIIDTLVTNSNPKSSYEISVTRASVNGIEVYPTYAEDVDADDECYEPIEISLSDVIENTEIHDISEIELAIAVEDDDMEIVYTDIVHFYPYGANNAVRYNRQAVDTDIVVVDNGEFMVTVTGFESVEDWGYSVHMYIQNKTDKTIYVEGADFSINDTDADIRYNDYVGAEGVSFSRLEWSQSDLDDAKVKEVTNITFNLKIYDEKAEDLLYSNTIMLNP